MILIVHLGMLGLWWNNWISERGTTVKIRELLSDESKWTQGFYARNSVGSEVEAIDPEACCWCLSGALMKCYCDYGRDTYSKRIVHLLIDRYNFSHSSRIGNLGIIPHWNDSSEREFDDVKRLVEELDI
jgi:hypothetical protein